jgi:hypothetical protein
LSPLKPDAGSSGANGEGDTTSQVANDEAQQEIMKLLNFPEVECAPKAPALAPKVSRCLQKRITKLQEFMKKFSGNLSENQKLKLVFSN